ncbi:MAG: DUF5596 domain-containing protein [Clostridiales bacterium]|nr:DUF5596 domain-containing protein [Clostridiales bacterium]
MGFDMREVLRAGLDAGLGGGRIEAVERAARLAAASPRATGLLLQEERALAEGRPSQSFERAELDALYRGAPDMHAALALLLRMPWLKAQYERAAIPDAVFRDTMSDLGIWMEVCRERTGQYGLIEYGWLVNHFAFRLFRLGRLQFIAGRSGVPARVYRGADGAVVALAPDGERYSPSGEADGTNGLYRPDAWTATLSERDGRVEGCPIDRRGLAERRTVSLALGDWRPALSPGDAILEVHVAEGQPLDTAECEASLARAPGFFARHLGLIGFRAFTCESWLLDWALQEIAPGGNIARFQDLFHRVPVRGGDRQTMERVFGGPVDDLGALPQDTSLRRAIVAHYRAGGRCREAYGFRLID